VVRITPKREHLPMAERVRGTKKRKRKKKLTFSDRPGLLNHLVTARPVAAGAEPDGLS
jgi:hypothetical protein